MFGKWDVISLFTHIGQTIEGDKECQAKQDSRDDKLQIDEWNDNFAKGDEWHTQASTLRLFHVYCSFFILLIKILILKLIN